MPIEMGATDCRCAEIPVEQRLTFDFVVNLETVRTLSISRLNEFRL